MSLEPDDVDDATERELGTYKNNFNFHRSASEDKCYFCGRTAEDFVNTFFHGISEEMDELSGSEPGTHQFQPEITFETFTFKYVADTRGGKRSIARLVTNALKRALSQDQPPEPLANFTLFMSVCPACHAFYKSAFRGSTLANIATMTFMGL